MVLSGSTDPRPESSTTSIMCADGNRLPALCFASTSSGTTATASPSGSCPTWSTDLINVNDPNLLGVSDALTDGYHYRVTVPADDTKDTIEKLQDLKSRILDGKRTVLSDWDHQGLSALGVPDHSYEPLLALKRKMAVIQPVPLDESEARFVRDLRTFTASGATGAERWELRFVRNRSKGSGVGFFEAGNFYPDFIVWLTSHGEQHGVLIDPKGLLPPPVQAPEDRVLQRDQTSREAARRPERSPSLVPRVEHRPRDGRTLGSFDRAEIHVKNIVFQDETPTTSRRSSRPSSQLQQVRGRSEV